MIISSITHVLQYNVITKVDISQRKILQLFSAYHFSILFPSSHPPNYSGLEPDQVRISVVQFLLWETTLLESCDVPLDKEVKEPAKANVILSHVLRQSFRKFEPGIALFPSLVNNLIVDIFCCCNPLNLRLCTWAVVTRNEKRIWNGGGSKNRETF